MMLWLEIVRPDAREGSLRLRACGPWHWALALTIIVQALLFGVSFTQAQTVKRVGIVFDDSGSMQGRTNLPVFGIQMLAGSLTNKDYLYGLTFKQYRAGRGPEPFRLNSSSEQQGAIDTLRRWAENPNVNTPYEPVEIMMNHLASTAAGHEDVHLFVFTDGAFNSHPPPGELDARYQRVKQALEQKRVKMRVHFVAFAPSQAEQKVIRDQRVAATLASVFNGNEDEDVHYVDNANKLREVLVGIVAAIADTEPEAKGQAARAVVRSGNKVIVTPPFTVTRVVVVNYSQAGQSMPKLASWPQKGSSRPRELSAHMTQPDQVSKAGAGADIRWQGMVSHLDYLPALEAGKMFELEFDQPITDNTRILFRSDVKLEWDVFDSAGRKIEPERDGTIIIGTNQDYEVRARLSSKDSSDPGDPTKEKPALFDYLTDDTQFFYLPHGQARQSMQINKKDHYASVKLRERQAGTRSAQVSIATPGFVTQRGREIKIRFEEMNFLPKLETEPLVQCNGCGPSRVELRLTPADGFKPAMKVKATFASMDPRLNGEVEFTIQGPLPPGVRVVLPGGRGTLEGARRSFTMAVSVGDSVELEFQVDGNLLSSLPDGHRILVGAEARRPLRGTGSANFMLVPLPEEARLVFSGTTDGAVGDTPFRVRPNGLNGRSGFFVKVEKAYGRPTVSDFDIGIAGLKQNVKLQPQGDIVLVTPLPNWWLYCCVWSGRYEINARFSNQHRQSAPPLRGHMIVEEVSWFERFLICLTLILTIIATVWFLIGFYRFLSSYRFPSRARLLQFPTGNPADAEYRKLARRPWPWLRPFVWPWSGNFNEQRNIAGLRLEAMSGGVRVLPKKGGYTSLHRGPEFRPLSELFKGGLEAVEVFWGTELVERGADKLTYRFVDRRGS